MLTFRNDSRWDARGLNYTIEVPSADLTFFFLDTSRGCPSYMSAPYGDCNARCAAQLASLAGCTPASADACWAAHLGWLDGALRAGGATSRWKFVIGHHPVSSENVRELSAVLEARGVQAALFGHVHDMQHAAASNGSAGVTVNHFIAGAGAFVNASVAHAHGSAAPAPRRAPPRSLAEACAGDACGGSARIEQRFGPANGPGFLALAVDNGAPGGPRTTATFHSVAGGEIYTVAFGLDGTQL